MESSHVTCWPIKKKINKIELGHVNVPSHTLPIFPIMLASTWEDLKLSFKCFYICSGLMETITFHLVNEIHAGELQWLLTWECLDINMLGYAWWFLCHAYLIVSCSVCISKEACYFLSCLHLNLLLSWPIKNSDHREWNFSTLYMHLYYF